MNDITIEDFYNEDKYYFFPYCIKKVKDDNYVVLNRMYKPLGMPGGEFVDYEDYMEPLALTEEIVKEISFNNVGNSADTIYLYDDWSAPKRSKEHFEAYKNTLKTLATIGIEIRV